MRERLPNRRYCEFTDLQFEGIEYTLSVGYYEDERIGECFAWGSKTGSNMDGILDDASIAISLLLQHGIEPQALSATMGRLGDGTTPASVIGAIADTLAELDDGRSAT